MGRGGAGGGASSAAAAAADTRVGAGVCAEEELKPVLSVIKTPLSTHACFGYLQAGQVGSEPVAAAGRSEGPFLATPGVAVLPEIDTDEECDSSDDDDDEPVCDIHFVNAMWYN